MAAVLASGCGSGGDPNGEAALAGRPTATVGDLPVIEAPATTTSVAPARISSGLPTTTARPSGGGAPPTTAASPAPAAALAPVAPGSYRYATSGRSTLGGTSTPFPAVTALAVDAPAGTRQRAVRDLRDPSGAGPVLEYVLDYRPDGIHLVSMVASTTVLLFTQSEGLAPEAPVLLLPTGAPAGAHVEADVPTTSGGTARLTIDVVGKAPITVAGERIDTVQVRLVAVVTGMLRGRIDLTVWLHPGTRVWAQERLVAEAATPDGAFSFRSDYSATVERLTPA